MTNKQLSVLILAIFGAVLLGYLLIAGLDFRSDAEKRLDRAAANQQAILENSMDNASILMGQEPTGDPPIPTQEEMKEFEKEMRAIDPRMKQAMDEARKTQLKTCEDLAEDDRQCDMYRAGYYENEVR